MELFKTYWGWKPIQFLNSWFSHPNFMKDFENYWGASCRDFPGDFRLIMKLAVMGKSFCIWNKTVFGNQNLKLVGVEQELRSLEKLGDNWPPFESEKERIKFISSERWDISRGMEDIWRQKSRLNWCKLGEITLDFSIYQLVCARLGLRFLGLSMKD